MARSELEIVLSAKDRASGPLGKLRSALGGIGKIAGGILAANLISGLGRQLVGLGRDSIGAASNLNESISKVGVIFNEVGDDIVAWSKTTAGSLGLSQQAALDAASTFATFGKSAGLVGPELSGFSTELSGLASDLASFYNTSPEDAITAIGAALRGESEPIRRYGVLLDDASLRQEALAQGIIKTTKQALTPQQRVMAAYGLIMKQTTDAQGDFARTSGGLANQQRILAANVDNLKSQLGQAFLPIATAVTSKLNELASKVMPALDRVMQSKEFQKFGQGLQSVFKTFSSLLSGDTEGALRNIGIAIVRFGQSLGLPIGQANELRDRFTGAFAALSDAYTRLVAPAVEKIKGTLSSLAGQVVPWVVGKFGELSAWFNGNRPLIESFVQTIANFAAALIAEIAKAWSFVQPILDGLIALVLGLAKTIMQVATGDWAGAWQTIQNTALAVWDALVAAVTNFINWVLGWFGTNLTEVVSVWQTNWDNLVTIVTTVWTNIQTTVSTKAAELVTMLQAKIAEFTAIGSAIIDGIKSGIESAWGGLQGLFQRLVGMLPEWAQNILGVSSPSKVFGDIGEQMAAGLAEGFGGAFDAVRSVMQAMIESAILAAIETVELFAFELTERLQPSMGLLYEAILQVITAIKDVIKMFVGGITYARLLAQAIRAIPESFTRVYTFKFVTVGSPPIGPRHDPRAGSPNNPDFSAADPPPIPTTNTLNPFGGGLNPFGGGGPAVNIYVNMPAGSRAADGYAFGKAAAQGYIDYSRSRGGR